MLRLAVLLLLSRAAPAQTTAPLPEFEVASVKPYVPPEPQGGVRRAFGRRGGPGTNDPGQITWNGASLKSLIVNAYGVKDYQVSGPPWLDTERFDIMAKVPEGTTNEQALLMWQQLLAARFELKMHRETREIPIYEITVAKGGVKLREAAAEPPPPPRPADAAPPAPMRLTRGADGCPVFPGGRGGTSMSMMPGRFLLCGQQITMDGLCSMLTGQLSRPVFDRTGLTAKYNFRLEFEPENNLAGMGMVPAAGGIANASQSGPPAEGTAARPPNMEPAPPVAAALQNQLGLKLEAKKAPAEMIVVDQVKKAPTEN